MKFGTKIYVSESHFENEVPIYIITKKLHNSMNLTSLQTVIKEKTQNKRITKRREH
jgi:hypothetical protein